MNDRISSFNPIIDEQSKILILGSVPGVKSLEQQEYYAHPQNKFWTIIFELLDAEFTLNYDLKLNILKQNKIALWDVIDSCERKGSLDSEIKNEEINDIKSILEMHPNIKAIFCNGGKSYKELVKILGKNYSIPFFLLPSTSPLHTISYEKKLNSWQIISKYL